VTDIFEEVEERLREDRLQKFVRKYGAHLLVAAVLAVAAVGAYGAYDAWRAAQARAAGETFSALQDQVRVDPAGAALALANFQKSAPGGYKALAGMERAGALEAQGDLAGAVAAFDDAARLASQPVVKQSAQMRAAYIAAETESFAALEARLKPLVETRGPFSYLARELIGVKAWEAGQFDRARQEFSYLETAFDAPQGVRQRASSFLQVVGPAAPAAASAPAAAPTEPTGEKQ
jgi:hypothetical protein